MQDAESCTGWAVGYAARAYYAATLEARDIRDLENVPSPSFIYNSVRDPKNCASGSYITDALSLLKRGSLSSEDFPMHGGCRIPSASERQRATDFRIESWATVDPQSVDDVKGQLAQGHPVIFGADAGANLENLRGADIYQGDTTVLGQHAMTLVGYDDTRQAFRVINSWGTPWGERGLGWIDYTAFTSMAREAYVLEVGEASAKTENQVSEVHPKPPIIPEPSPPKPPEEQAVVKPPIDRPVVSSDCSYVYSDASAGSKVLRGFVGSEADLANLRAQWRSYVDGFAVEVRPWPQCEVLLTLASAIGANGGPLLNTKNNQVQFSHGDPIVLQLQTPPAPSYLYVVYVQADGSVVTLLEPSSDLAPSRGGEQISFGDGSAGSPKFTAAKPYGAEMMLAVASASPLFSGPLPRKQTEREFLSTLRRAILYKSDQTMGERRISAAFLGITTEEKK
jgi:hypothetical protein